MEGEYVGLEAEVMDEEPHRLEATQTRSHIDYFRLLSVFTFLKDD